jgi:predicted O-methyltransferase YrrM
MAYEELAWLAEQASKHDVIVEIGSYQGRSTRAMGDSAKGIVYAVDDWKGLRTIDTEWWTKETPKDVRETLFERFVANMQDLIDIGKVTIICSDHAKVSELAPKADMIFIDGDHSYAGVKRDIETWLPLLNEGGLICGHDANQGELMRAVNELLPGNAVAVGLIWMWGRP